MTAALKEWSAAVHALLDGRQTVLLRKGGIGEKRFAVEADEFLLFPTVAHRVVIRAAAKVVAAVAVHRDECLDEIEDLHIWTAESVHTDRLDFRPRHRLTVLVMQAVPLAEPIRLPREPQYAGCTSWVQLPVSAELGEPVYDGDALAAIAGRVRAAVA